MLPRTKHIGGLRGERLGFGGIPGGQARFGEQRFGRRANNDQLGAALLRARSPKVRTVKDKPTS